ncbi:GumC family protein [Falsirhodobacter sp. 20TX0035]|uniref:GumC family protein n=1 Tax=Falsirhodobacter sp. 20TX0035 TaxID=3022019 RepID=UPI00232ADFD7|nr:GNVR domain-containing protein [Falsirhodobacter sp. 20TX0035]MDB6452955.1 GNVR domain-containing protein [Falsirhodobacter sp. 20TX0035]
MNAIQFYLSRFLRRLPLFLGILALVGGLALFVALRLPASYASHVLLVVEGAPIPTELAQATVQTPAEERLQMIQTRLMTRANLLQTARDLKVFEDIEAMTPDQIVAAMVAATTIKTSSGRGQANQMTLSFEASSAEIAAGVLNRYLELILSADTKVRSSRAAETQQFFQQEVARLEQDLATRSAAIVDFKRDNIDALPENLEMRNNLQAANAARLQAIALERRELQEQRKQMVDLFRATGRVAGSNETRSAREEKVEELEMQLSDLLAVYPEDNTLVRVTRDRIAALKSVTGGTEEGVSPAEAVLNIQLASLDAGLANLDEETARLEEAQTKLAEGIARTPVNAIALEGLERDYSNVQARYVAASSGLSQAATGERMEIMSRGGRISVVEQPSVPSKPTRPNRKLIAAGGIFLGVVLGVAAIVLLEMLNRTARRPADIVNRLGIMPIATIPYMPSVREAARQRTVRFGRSFAALAGVVVLLVGLHLFYKPLDQIALRVMSTIGFRG